MLDLIHNLVIISLSFDLKNIYMYIKLVQFSSHEIFFDGINNYVHKTIVSAAHISISKRNSLLSVFADCDNKQWKRGTRDWLARGEGRAVLNAAKASGGPAAGITAV